MQMQQHLHVSGKLVAGRIRKIHSDNSHLRKGRVPTGDPLVSQLGEDPGSRVNFDFTRYICLARRLVSRPRLALTFFRAIMDEPFGCVG